MPAPRTVTLTVTSSSHPQYRYTATMRGPNGQTMSGRFQWPADLNQWVQRARRSADRHGWAVDVHDDTGEVR